VFCDGWTFHRNCIREDAVKRNAIVLGGRFHVWAVTHDDVKAALAGDTRTDLESPLVSMNRNQPEALRTNMLEQRPRAFSENAVARLIRLLALGDEPGNDRVTSELRKDAEWAMLLMAERPGQPSCVALDAEMAELWKRLPDWMNQKPVPSIPAGSREGSAPLVRYWFPGTRNLKLTPGVLVLDDRSGLNDRDSQLVWRSWIWIFNVVQTLPGFLMATGRGLENRDYEVLSAPAKSVSSVVPGEAERMSAWRETLDAIAEAVRSGTSQLAQAGVPPPDRIGFEQADDDGNVVAEAELAWSADRTVVILESQREYSPMWESLGWRVVVAEGEWHLQVLKRLSAKGDN
jgi:DEAD/DEAH box helicase domain-containing protein